MPEADYAGGARLDREDAELRRKSRYMTFLPAQLPLSSKICSSSSSNRKLTGYTVQHDLFVGNQKDSNFELVVIRACCRKIAEAASRRRCIFR
jgi:hypothetical protein